MESEIRVSIVMPVYNAVKYIDKTIQSILNQTYKNYELIIIDDGATDGSSEICMLYAANNRQIRYFRQENKGTCAARNLGIELSRGEYISFFDHDDEYLQNYLEVMMEIAERNKADMVKCGVFFEESYADGSVKVRKEVFKKRIITREELIDLYNQLPISYFGVWNTLYKVSVLKDNYVRCPERIKHGQEDYFFNTSIVPFLNRIGFSDQCLYKHYRRINQSTSAKYYADRIDAMAEYFQLEVKTLSLFICESDWKQYYALLYARKITGVLAYVFQTNVGVHNETVKKILERYLMLCPYDETMTCLDWFAMCHTSKKYMCILWLILHNEKYLLIYLWRAKNAMS